MKKTKRIMLRIIPVLIVACIMLTRSVLASGFGDFTANMVVDNSNYSNTSVINLNRITDFIIGILPMVSIFTIVFCLIKYIVSSKEKKVKLRKKLLFIVILASFVFVVSEISILWTTPYDE